MKILYTYHEVAAILGYRNTKIIRRLVASGVLTPVRLEHNSFPRIHRADLEYLDTCLQPSIFIPSAPAPAPAAIQQAEPITGNSALQAIQGLKR